jgi:predicted ATPase
MSRTEHWFVLTGAPSAGKTSVLTRLRQAGYLTVPEASRAHIDEALARGMSLGEVRHDTQAFEHAVLERMLRAEMQLAVDTITFFDRALHDVSAYYNLHGLPADELLARGYDSHAIYARAFLLEFRDMRADYARMEDASTARRLEGMLETAYAEATIPVTRLPWAPLDERVAAILEYVGPPTRSTRHACG